MGLHDRDYYRDGKSSGGFGALGIDGLTPVVKYLLIANVAIFLLQIFWVRELRVSPLEIMRRQIPELDKLLTRAEQGDPKAQEALKKKYPGYDTPASDVEPDDWLQHPQRVSVVQEWFELDTNKVIGSGQVWRLLTHAFCHDRGGVFHILFNMLFLFWFGCTLETMYGSREFLLFYLTAAVVSGLAFVGLDLYTGSSTPGIGASGAVLAVTMLYTVHFPYESICIFWVLRIEMRWLMVLYVIWDLHPILLTLAGDRFSTGIAHAAHLGGLAFGFAYGRYQWRLDTIGEHFSWLRRIFKRRPRLRLAPQTLPESIADDEMDQVDKLLQKIAASGQASLTDEERDILRRASERMRERRR